MATLAVFEAPIPIRLAGRLSPLFPDQLLDLLRRGRAQQIIIETGQDIFALSPRIPKQLRDQIHAINSRDRLNNIYQMIREEHVCDDISPDLFVTLLKKCGHEQELADSYAEMVDTAIESGDRAAAYEYCLNVIQLIRPNLGKNHNDVQFVNICLKFCNLYDFLGKFDTSFQDIINRAIAIAEQIGDRRSQALLQFNLGYYLWLHGQTAKANAVLESGRRIVEDLGDDDIRNRSNDFIGIYYYAQGLNKKALTYFEKSEFELTADHGLLQIPGFMAYSAAYTGQFDRAIGLLHYYMHFTMKKGLDSVSCVYRVCLGVFLLVINRTSEAIRHIQQASKTANEHNNELAIHCVELALALYHYKIHRHDEAKKLLDKALNRISASELSILTLDPWYIELLFDLEHLGYPPLDEFRFSKVAKRILQENNCHFKGVILRLKAQEHLADGKSGKTIRKCLNESEVYLKMSEDPIQLAKTRVDIARLLLSQKQVEAAKDMAVKARQGLPDRWEHFFPDDLRSLLAEDDKIVTERRTEDNFIDRFLDMTARLTVTPSMEKNLSNLLAHMNKLLGADRAAVFLTDDQNELQPIVFIKLNRREIRSGKFQSSMKLVGKCHRENSPLLTMGNDRTQVEFSIPKPTAAICLPLEIKNEQLGVFYHDSFYIPDSLNGLDEKKMISICKQLSGHVARYREIGRLLKNTRKAVTQDSNGIIESNSPDFIAASPTVREVVHLADRAAKTDSTLLIMGETGVGKELLAKRIHSMSQRASESYIVVDAATIPENLVESELFGHERGAFTGADRRKIGKIELADKGTLFIDEIGEMPLTTQVKLLRVIQERNFFRIGGTISINSNFRLVAATNRDLEAEVKNGTFRKDLYFRLNTLPITLPPLRNRKEDIVKLITHFLEKFSKKYNRYNLTLSPGEENKAKQYGWPGNIRELENLMERSVILAEGEMLELNLSNGIGPCEIPEFSEVMTLDELQRRYIKFILNKTGGKLSGPGSAAELLGINRVTLYSRMKKLGIN